MFSIDVENKNLENLQAWYFFQALKSQDRLQFNNIFVIVFKTKFIIHKSRGEQFEIWTGFGPDGNTEKMGRV